MEIWEPKPPGNLWATPDLLWDSFSFLLIYVRTLVVDQRRWDGIVGVANRLMAKRSGFESRQDKK
jgi:hypothetical protein